MGAPKGHKKWGNPINPKKYTAEELWEVACKYFDWAEKSSIKMAEPIKSGLGAGTMINVPHRRPLSIERLCIYADINTQTFYNYEKIKDDKTYLDVCTRIRQIIDDNQFEGGMVGQFNANIVTRKLGLVDKQDIKTTSQQDEFLKKFLYSQE